MNKMEIIDNENGKKWVIEKVSEEYYSLTYFEYLNSLGWASCVINEKCNREYLENTFNIDLSKPQPAVLYI